MVNTIEHLVIAIAWVASSIESFLMATSGAERSELCAGFGADEPHVLPR